MITKLQRLKACNGLLKKSISVVTQCNALSRKQDELSDELQKRCTKIEKKYPKKYYYRKDYMDAFWAWGKSLERFTYYNKTARKEIIASNEYKARAESM